MTQQGKESSKDSRLIESGSFFLKLVLIWLSWKMFVYIIGEEKVPLDERFFPGISAQWESLNSWLRLLILNSSEFLLNAAGHQTHLEQEYLLKIDGFGGISMGNYCLGFQLMYYFTMLMLLSGFSLQTKIAGIISGILAIQLLNLLRVAGLVWIDAFMPQWRFISHDYLFNIIVFGFLLMFYWKLLNRKNKIAGVRSR